MAHFRLLVLTLIVLAPLFVDAGPFRIVNRTYGTATSYQADIDLVYNTLEQTVNFLLPQSGSDVFLKRMGNSGSLAGAGLGADYGSTFDLFMLGAGGGVAFEGGQADPGALSWKSVGGLGAQVNVSVGMPLRVLSTGDFLGLVPVDKSKFFLGVFTYNLSSGSTSLSTTTLSALVQYRFLDRSYRWWDSLKWGGVDLTAGFRWTQTRILFEEKINQSISQVVPMPLNPTVTMNYNGKVRGGAEINILTLPVEVSTSARLLYFMTPFIGMGTDVAVGMSKSLASIDGPITVTESSGTYGTLSANAELDLGGTGSPQPFLLRGFAGLQIQAGIVAVSAQMNKGFGASQLTGTTFMLKAYY